MHSKKNYQSKVANKIIESNSKKKRTKSESHVAVEYEDHKLKKSKSDLNPKSKKIKKNESKHEKTSRKSSKSEEDDDVVCVQCERCQKWRRIVDSKH